MSDELPVERESIRLAALGLKCPRCGMPPGASCQSSRGKFLPNLHAERLAAGEGYPFRGWVWHVLSGDG